MTLQGLGLRLKQLLMGTAAERRHLLYLTRMKLKGIDLDAESLESLGIGPDSSRYSDSGGPDLEVVLNSLPISSEDVALDLGCGKAGPLLTMAKYPFSRVDGIDISPELVEIARRNIERLRIRNAEVICCDAAAFEGFARYTCIYMYNPFPSVVMQQVTELLVDSLSRQPRRFTVIYKNPVLHDLIAAAGFVKTREFQHSETPFYIYEYPSELRVPDQQVFTEQEQSVRAGVHRA